MSKTNKERAVDYLVGMCDKTVYKARNPGGTFTDIRNMATKAVDKIEDMIAEGVPDEPDEPVELGPKYEQAHYGLFTWNWFLWKAWEPNTRDKWTKELKKTMTAVRKLGFSTHEIFSWVSSGRQGEAHYNKKLPWKITNKKVDFNEYEENWWDILELFFEVHKDLGMEVMITLFMRPQMYLKWALRNAKGGAVDFYSDEMFKVWKRFTRDIIYVYKSVYGINACPLIKPSNEWNHKGPGPGANKNENGYIFAQFHVNIFDAIRDLLPGSTDREKVKHIVGDPTLCEWVTNCFTHPHEGPGGYTVGDWRFVGPRPKKDRFVTRDHHRFGIKKDYMTDDFMITLTNGPWSTSVVICSEDGAKVIGTPEQCEEATEYAQRMAKKYDRPIHNTFMNVECLVNDREDCTLKHLIDSGSMARAEAFMKGIKRGIQ